MQSTTTMARQLGVPRASADRLGQLTLRNYALLEPAYRDRLGEIDAMRVQDDLYRSCVPGPDPRRWLCLFVNTRQHPAGVSLDHDRAPNTTYRRHGGFQ